MNFYYNHSHIWLGHKHYFFVLLGLEMINFHWRGINHTIKKTVININNNIE